MKETMLSLFAIIQEETFNEWQMGFFTIVKKGVFRNDNNFHVFVLYKKANYAWGTSQIIEMQLRYLDSKQFV